MRYERLLQVQKTSTGSVKGKQGLHLKIGSNNTHEPVPARVRENADKQGNSRTSGHLPPRLPELSQTTSQPTNPAVNAKFRKAVSVLFSSQRFC